MPSRVVRFGNDLELDRSAYELRRSGRPLKLERIPLELLFLLVERTGQLVTREEIIEKVWGKDLFFDTDNSINAAIRKIRQALRDDPEKPRFVQTITGKGYRFVAPTAEAQPPLDGHSPPVARDLARAGRGSDRTATPRGLGRVWIVLAVVGVLALSVVVFVFLHAPRPAKLTEKDTVVLADFTNTTGDPVFEGTLRQGLAVELEQSPFLSLISEERVQQTLRLMGQPVDAPLTRQRALEICERTGSVAVLEGSIASLGREYALGLRAEKCGTGDVVDEEQAQAARKEDVLNALSEIATKFRTRAGESLKTVEEHNTPLAEATTPSLEALKAYSAAWKVAFSVGWSAAIPLLKRAVEIDPRFAVAYAFLGRNYGDMGESELSAESTNQAYQLRDRASDRERFFITATYDEQVTGNLQKARETCELWAETYPRDAVPHGLLSYIDQNLGLYQESIAEAQKGIGIDADFTPGYVNLAFADAYLGRLQEAESALQRASDRQLSVPDLLLLRYCLDFLAGDRAGMEREAAEGRGKSGTEDWLAQQQGFVLAYSGQLQKATRMSQEAVALAEQAAQPERAAMYQAGAALWKAFLGEAPGARRSAISALKLSKGREVEYGAAFALALSGDSSRSQKLANDLAKRFPQDASVQFSYLPALRALIALDHGEPSHSIELLQPALPYDLAVPGSSLFGFFGTLYPAYARGVSYMALHHGAQAATEFQKILDHPGLVFSDPIGAVARFQTARASTLSGDKAKARAACQDFLTLWKDADASIPILKQAQVECANR